MKKLTNDIEKAIDALKMDNALMEFDPSTGDERPIEFQNELNQCVYKANLLAISALEKQIAKKPKKIKLRQGTQLGCGKMINISDLAEHLTQYAEYAFAHKDREELERVLKEYFESLNNRWIPVSERLPQLPDGKSFMPLNVTILAPSGLRNTVPMTWELKRGKFTWCYLGEASDWNVIAWQPLPEPWKESVEE